MRSACRGVARNAPAPKRSRSKREAPTAIISMAQHARPKVIGQIEFLRPQLMKKSRLVTIRPSSKRFSIQDIVVLMIAAPSSNYERRRTGTRNVSHTTHEPLRRHQRLFVPGVEREVLSEGPA